MATQKLDDKTIKTARTTVAKRIEMWDEQTPGLCLRVSARRGKPGEPDRQTKVWVWRYRTLDGRQPRLTLAAYSDTHGLKWARLEVEEWRVRVRKGEDPAGTKRADKARARAEPLKTFDDLADAFITASEKGHWKPRRKQKRPRTIADETAILTRYIRPTLGGQRIEAIDRKMISKVLNDMLDRGIGAQTNRTHAVIRQVLAYGVDRERIEWNPAAQIAKPASEKARARTLTDDELSRLWNICENCPAELRAPPKEGETIGARLYVSRAMRIAVQLATLLLVRRNEIAGMAVSELDLDRATWLIPAERMKAGAPHLVPLPPRAVAFIGEALKLAAGDRSDEPPYVFPSPRDRERPIRPDAITHAMAHLCLVLGIKNASPHDIRRTGSTTLTSERLGFIPLIRSRVLSHGSDTGGGAPVSSNHYDVNEYLSEKRKALTAWEGLLLEIVGDRERPTNVAPIRGVAN